MTDSIRTYNYVARFRCIGADCEDDCCHGWKVELNQDEYEALRCGLPAGQFEGGVKREPEKEAGFAFLTHDQQRICSFLDQGLCTIHRDQGEALLPDVCAIYPRSVLEVDGQTCVTANISCPEVARELLLQPDALAQAEVAESDFGRSVAFGKVDSRGGHPYAGSYEEVQEYVLQLLQLESLRVEQKLILLTFFANSTKPFFSKEISDNREPELQQAMELCRDEQTRAQLFQSMDAAPVPGSLVVPLINRILHRGLQLGGTHQFRDLLGNVLKHVTERFGKQAKAEQVWPLYQERRAEIESRFSGSMEQYFSNFATNYWLQWPYCESQDLLAHTQRLLAQVAVIRFLFCCQPQIPQDKAELDRLAVSVFYSSARSFQHTTLLDLLQDDLSAQGMGGDAGSMFLAKF